MGVQTILMGGLRWRQTLYTSMWGAQAPSVWLQVGLAPLWLASQCYRGLARGHLASYTWGVRRRRQLPCAVVSIGNLTLGGTGKTPLGEVADTDNGTGLACGHTEPRLWGAPGSVLTRRIVGPWSSPRLAGSRRRTVSAGVLPPRGASVDWQGSLSHGALCVRAVWRSRTDSR